MICFHHSGAHQHHQYCAITFAHGDQTIWNVKVPDPLWTLTTINSKWFWMFNNSHQTKLPLRPQTNSLLLKANTKKKPTNTGKSNYKFARTICLNLLLNNFTSTLKLVLQQQQQQNVNDSYNHIDCEIHNLSVVFFILLHFHNNLRCKLKIQSVCFQRKPKFVYTLLFFCVNFSYISRQFTRRYNLPANTTANDVQSSLSSDGVLTITAVRKPVEQQNAERVVPITQTGPSQKTEESKKEAGASSTASESSTAKVE